MAFIFSRVEYTKKSLLRKIGEMLAFLKKDYPNFYKWYSFKVLPGLKNQSRQIFTATSVVDTNNIAGIMILKNERFEKKICTLYVFEDYRKQGLGSEFIELAIKQLGTETPFITVADPHKKEFERVLTKYGFVCYKDYPGFYKKGVSEYAYNGFLSSKQEPSNDVFVVNG